MTPLHLVKSWLVWVVRVTYRSYMMDKVRLVIEYIRYNVWTQVVGVVLLILGAASLVSTGKDHSTPPRIVTFPDKPAPAVVVSPVLPPVVEEVVVEEVQIEDATALVADLIGDEPVVEPVVENE